MALTRFRAREPREEPLRLVTDGEERFDAYLDAGCELTGRLDFQGSVRIDGKVAGEIDSAKTIVVGEHAQLRARIAADFVVVHGSVDGDIVARRKITLTKNAQVTGDIRTVGVVIEEGAKLRGRIAIGLEDEEEGACTSNAGGSASRRSSRRKAAAPAA